MNIKQRLDTTLTEERKYNRKRIIRTRRSRNDIGCKIELSLTNTIVLRTPWWRGSVSQHTTPDNWYIIGPKVLVRTASSPNSSPMSSVNHLLRRNCCVASVDQKLAQHELCHLNPKHCDPLRQSSCRRDNFVLRFLSRTPYSVRIWFGYLLPDASAQYVTVHCGSLMMRWQRCSKRHACDASLVKLQRNLILHHHDLGSDRHCTFLQGNGSRCWTPF